MTEDNVKVDFVLDTKGGNVTETITTRHTDEGKARDKVKKVIQEADPFLSMFDAETGDYVLVHSMKVASVKVYEAENDK